MKWRYLFLLKAARMGGLVGDNGCHLHHVLPAQVFFPARRLFSEKTGWESFFFLKCIRVDGQQAAKGSTLYKLDYIKNKGKGSESEQTMIYGTHRFEEFFLYYMCALNIRPLAGLVHFIRNELFPSAGQLLLGYLKLCCWQMTAVLPRCLPRSHADTAGFPPLGSWFLFDWLLFDQSCLNSCLNISVINCKDCVCVCVMVAQLA